MAATIQIIANLQNNAASPIKALRSDIEGLGDGADKASFGFSRLQSAGAVATSALVAGVTAAGVAIGAFMVKGVQMAADMEAQISGIAAVWNTTADAIAPVKDLIQDLGLDPNLKVTAVEAASAIEMLAKNGLTMDQVLQGAAYSTVLLANATGADFNTAATVATDVMALFGIKAEDMKTAVDGITSVTVASKFAIDDYALALAQGGGVASLMGVSFADFNTALVATSAYFKSGSDAGTSFKTFLQRLIPTTNEAEDLMRSLGLITDETGNRFYDAQGNMKSMGEIAGILNSTFKDMTEAQRNAALETLFGTDALRFAAGIAGYSRVEFEKLQKVMGDTDALEQAKTRVDNFRGAWEIFLGVIEGLQMQLGSALLPMLRLFVEFLTGQLVNAGSSLIDIFERIAEAFTMFQQSLEGGQSPLQAFMGLVQQIGLAFGLSMEQATLLGNAIAGVVGIIAGVASAVLSFVGQFLSWKDVLLAIGISIASFVLPLISTLVGGFLSLIAPILAVAVGIAALRAAWEADFLGIRTAVEGLAETAGKVLAVFAGPGGLFDNLMSGESVVSALGQAIMNLGMALGLPISTVGDLLQGFVLLSESVSTFMDTLRAGGSLADAFSGALTTLREGIFNWVGTSDWGEIGSMILDQIAGAFASLGDRAAEAAANILNWISTAVNSVDWQAVGETIVNGIAAAIAAVAGVLTIAGTAIVNFFSGFFANDNLKAAGEGLVTALGNAISGAAAGISTALDGIRQAIFDWAGGDSWSEVGGTILDRIGAAFLNLGDRVAEIQAGIFNWIAGAINSVDWPNVGQTLINALAAAVTGALGLLATVGTAVINYFVGFFSNPDIGPAAQNLITAFANAIAGLASGIGTGLQAIWQAITTYFANIDWGGVGQAILTGISNALSSAGIDPATVLGPLTNIFSEIDRVFSPMFDRLREVFGNLGESLAPLGDKLSTLKDSFARLGEAVQPVLSVLGTLAGYVAGVFGLIAGVIGAAIGVIANFLGNLLAGIIANAGTIIGGLVTAVTGIVDGITNAVQSIVDFVRAIFQGDWAAAWEAAKGYVIGLVESIKTILSGLLQVIGGILTAIWDAVVNTVNDLTGATLPTWEEFKTGIIDKFNETKEGITTAVEGWKEAISSKIEEIKSSITTTVEGWKTAIVDGVAAIKEGIVSKIEEWKEAFTSFGDSVKQINIGESLKTTIVDGIASIAESIREKVSEWVESFRTFAENVRNINIGETIVDYIVSGLETFITNVGSTLSGWFNAFTTWVGNIDWYDVGYTIVDFILTALYDFPMEVADTLQEWGQAFFDWAEETANDLIDSGAEIIEAIIEGLKEFPDKVADTLQEWIQAFIDWATDTADEVQDTGTTIIESVIEGLKEFPSQVAATLQEWVQAFIDWATDTADEVQDTGTTIIEAIIDGLKEFPGKVADTLHEWTQAFWDWVTNTAAELQETGRQIIDAIITGLTEFPTLVAATLQSWITAFATWVGSSIAQLVIIGTAIVTHIVSAFSTFWEKAVVTVSTWFTSLSTYVGEKIADLIALGSSIVEGIITGIQNMAQAVIDAAGAVIQGGIDAIRAHLGNPHSPAPALIPLGGSISEGIAAGIILKSGTVTDAIGQLASQIDTEGAKAFGEAMKSLAEGLAAGLNAILDLSAFPGVGGSFLDNLRSVVAMLAQMVTEVNTANTYGEEALKLLEVFVGVASGIADLIVPLLTALIEIAAFRPINTDVFTKAMQQLATFLALIVNYLLAAGQHAVEVYERLSAFVDVMAQIADMVGPFLAALQDINAFGAARLDFFHEGIAHLWYTMLLVSDKVLELADLGQETLARMGGFVEVMGAIADLIAPMIQALYELNAFGAAHLDFFHEGIAHLAYTLIIVAQAFVQANQFGSVALEQARNLAETAGVIAGIVGPMITALLSINTLSSSIADIGLQAVYFRNGMVLLVYHLSTGAALFTTGLLQHVRAFAEAAGAVVDLISPAVEGLMIIGTLTGDLNYIGLQAVYFRNGLVLLVYHLSTGAVLFTSALLQQVRNFAETAGTIVELIAPAVEGMAIIGTLSGELNNIGLQAVYFRNGLVLIVYHLSTGAVLFSAELLAQVRAFAETAGVILELVADGIDALKLLAMYVSAANLPAAAAAFAIDLTTVINTLVSVLQWSGVLTNQAVAEAGELADDIKDLLAMITEGVEALAALAVYAPIANAYSVVSAFANDLVVVITTLVNYLQWSGILADDAVMAAGELADDIKDLLAMIGEGVEALASLATYVPIANAQSVASAFAADLVIVITTILAALQASGILSDQATAVAGELSGDISDLLDMIGAGVEALVAIAVYAPIANAQAAINAFAADLVLVITTLVAAFQASGILANQAVLAAGEMAGAMSDIVDVVAPAVEAVVLLVGYTTVGGLQTNVRQFAADLVIVVQTLVDGLSQAGLLANEAVAQAGEMAKSIEDILKVVEPALHPDKGALSLIAKYVSDGGLAAKAQKFTDDLILVTQTLVNGLTTSALAAGVALAKAGEMAKSLKDLFDAIKPAMDTIGELANYTSAANLATKAQQFTTDLITVANILVSGLTQAANQLGAEAVSAAHAFAQSISLMVSRSQAIVESLSTMGNLPTPNIEPKLLYITTSAEQIKTAFTSAGDIGQAVQYAELFRQNLEQLVHEVQLALAQLDALARANVPGSLQAILDAMVAALRNAVGDFSGAGEALASAVEEAFRSGDYEGAGQDAGQGFIDGLESQEGAAVNAIEDILSTMLTLARNYAANFAEVGRLLIAAITAGIQTSAQLVVSAVLVVLQAALNAGRTLLGSANQLGSDLGRAAADGMLSTRSALDSAGASAGASLIEGLRRAIANGQSSIVNQIIATVRAAIQAAQNALGIHSPSRVFYRIGEFLIDGFRRGIEVGVAPVIRAVGRMAREVTNTVENGLSIRVPAVQLSGALLPAPVAMSGVTPRYSIPAPVMSPIAAAVRPLPVTAGAGDMYVTNDIQVSVTFPNGTTATPADIKKAVQAGIEEAMLNSGRRADASRRLR